MVPSTTETLNALLREELAAVETYQQALAKFEDAKGVQDLQRLDAEHRAAVDNLRQQVRQQGGEPEAAARPWGVFAQVGQRTAKQVADQAALTALKEGEEHSIQAYEDALLTGTLPPDADAFIASTLLPKAREHLTVLDRLMVGMVDRVSPQRARQDLKADPPALLICAYDSESKFRDNYIEGALSLKDFVSQAETIPKYTELIFYCS